MGFFDDIFGGVFDFNGDGKTDFGEEWLGYMIINECMKEEEQESRYNDNIIYDSSDDDLLEPIDHLADTEDDSWKLFCEDGSDYDVDPDDYDSEEEYEGALEEAKSLYESTDIYEEDDEYAEDDGFEDDIVPATIPLALSFEITYPGKEQLDAINESDYPNKRAYRAAYGLCEIEHGNPYIPTDSSKEKESERFKFILSDSCVASKYLTTYDGFLYAQAIKENFTLPIDYEDEDEESSVWFPDIFMELAEEDPALAVEVWAWCIKEFGSYQHYMKNKSIIYSYITSSVDDYPPEFIDIAIDKLGSDVEFCDGLLTKCPEMPYSISAFISQALEKNKVKEAQMIFTSTMLNPLVKGKDAEDFINSIISRCSNWEELETMEAFKFNILPIVKKMNDKRIQRVLPKIVEEVDHYILHVERSEEKYQYSRSFAWRNKYLNDDTDLDPLDYETEDEYLNAVDLEKYGWRRWHSEAKRYNIDVNSIETEEEYLTILQQKRAEEAEARKKEKTARFVDPLAETDKTIYNFCSVIFQSSTQPYCYLTGDLDIEIGDKVLVPVGKDGEEVVATVVSTSKHMRLTAPYSVDKAKSVIKKL